MMDKADKTQQQQGTQQLNTPASDDQQGGRRRERGSARPVFLSLGGLVLGLLLCGIGFGFGYMAGRIHGDALRYNNSRLTINIPDPLRYTSGRPGDNFIFIPGQGFGYTCENLPQADAPGARAWLGVAVEGVNDNPIVAEVIADSPAAEARLEVGDVILEVDGERTRDYDALTRILADHEPCDEVTLLIERDGDEEEIEATLGGIVPAD